MALDADRVHTESLVVDLHCDTVHKMRSGYDISKRHGNYHIDIPRLQEGGVNVQVFASSISPHIPGERHKEVVEQSIDFLKAEAERCGDSIVTCRTVSEVEQAASGARLAVLLSIENGMALKNDPANVEYFWQKGVRLITIAHFASTDWCIAWNDSSPRFRGLNALGREMIAEMNRVGVIIDVSHSAPPTVRKVLAASKHPVVASHSCVWALCPHKRNLTDDQIRNLADNGGMVGITFVNSFLSERFYEADSAYWEDHPEEIEAPSRRRNHSAPLLFDYESTLAPVRPSVATVADHIDHVVGLVGADHVGLGSDYDGISWPPLGLEDCSRFPNITRELVKRGYGETSIRKILGGNFMRVFREVCG